MKKIYAVAFLFCIAIVACKNSSGKKGEYSRIELWAQIQKVEAVANNPKTADFQTISDSLLGLYQEYDQRFYEEKDKKRLQHCVFEAGRLAMNLKKSDLALKLFKQFRQNFHLDKRSSTALFLEAFIYENQLNELGKAKQTYQTFIDDYPNDDLVKTAKISIQNLGKSPEELVKEFEAKDSAKKAANAGN